MDNRIEMLIATMNRDNLDFLRDINLQTDAVIANQTDHFSQELLNTPTGKIKLISTLERGVGRNRNIALANSTAKYCMIADDDNTYVDNYAQKVYKGFSVCPKADILVFNTEIKGKERYKSKKVQRIHRVHIWNFCRYGAVRIVINRTSWEKKPVFFSELYGGGAKYGAGEDVLFLRECIRKRYRIYAVPETLLYVNQEQSTWFTGYDQKFYYDKGALAGALFPYGKIFAGIYFLVKFLKLSAIPWYEAGRMIIRGIFGEEMGWSYNDYVSERRK